jgi:hypothetical protein
MSPRREIDATPPPFATTAVGAVAAAVALLLLVMAGRYGYHRDELYFLAAGRHLAWGYPDQPPLVPVLARGMSFLAPGSLVALRLPSVVAAVLIVVATAGTARELGAQRSGQTLAAAGIALSAVFLGACHLLSTTTFDLLAWALVLWLVVRILRTGNNRLWLVVGVVSGVGLLDSDLLVFLLAGLTVGIAALGPRDVFTSRWLWAGAVVAAAMWTPYLVWQAQHGWPQLAQSRAIAAGQSGTSAPRALFLPYQVVLAGPWIAPVWIVGLVRLLRGEALRWLRPLGIAWVVAAAVFLGTGGKPYYLSGFLPLLFAAGAQPVVGWMDRRRRRVLAAAAVALSLPGIAVALPAVPMSDVGRSHLVAVDYDLGEQIAWPTYVRQVQATYDGATAAGQRDVQIVTSNYGEAGALERYWQPSPRPGIFSGQTGFWYWGRPTAPTVLALGYSRAFLTRYFTRTRLMARLHNDLGVDNDENGAPVWLCTGLRRPWPRIWPEFRHT